MGALGSPVRREILRLIWDQELPAGEIAAAFDVTKPTISQHLAVLRDAGLVRMKAVGTSRRYRAVPSRLVGLHGALAGQDKWQLADDVPERALAEAGTRPVAVVSVEVETDQASTFAAFMDPTIYSQWLGVPVSMAGGRFSATMEWGTEVRGTYELVVPPRLIVMRWDFEDETVPVPGGAFTGYLWVHQSVGRGSTVEVHQLVDTAEEAEFMEGAWSMVLGRLRLGVAEATGAKAAGGRRRARAKRRASA